MSKPVIRRARPDDAGDAARVHCAAAIVAYRSIFPADGEKPTPASLTPEWATRIADPASDVFIAEVADHGAIIGAAGLSPDPSVPSGWVLSRLYVDPAAQGGGIGSRLHDAVLDRARERGLRELNLWVLEANEPARRLYERLGWTLVPGPTLANDPPSIVDVLYRRLVSA